MYIVGYTVGKLVLWRCVSGAVKRDFRKNIRRHTSPNANLEYSYPHSNELLTFSLQKDSENVLCCAYTSAAASCTKPLANEKRNYVMTSGFRQYIAGYTVANL